jgi:SnoaL-like polyketide cyclase
MQTIVIEISQSALPGWRLLPHCVRWHVGAFPGVSASALTYGTPRFVESLAPSATPPAESDIAETAARLTTAFPRLVRRVTAVATSARFTVRLECEGVHEGMWGVIYPTLRRVAFDEAHEIVALGGRIVSDRITIDVPSILGQLCGSDIDPDETARMGRARRLHERGERAARGPRRGIP